MAKKEYDWHIGNTPPNIELHSLAKHRVYEEYLLHYIQVLNSNPLIPEFRISLIDGFAGGGVYTDSQGGSYLGSPLRLIKVAEAAEVAVNTKRQSSGVRANFKLHAEYFFIEKKRSNYDHLKWFLAEQGYKQQLDCNIFTLQGCFTEKLSGVINHLVSKGRKRRCIFLLDQYGYGEVPFSDVNAIFSNLPNAEIILTFATDWLIDYMADTPEYLKALQRIGIVADLNIKDLLETKRDGSQWRQLVQFELHRSINKLSGAKHYTPFFIVSKESGRSFWLVHLSNHPRARDVMTQLHWSLKNHFAHYGGPGIKMFGYDPIRDDELTGLIDIFGKTEYSFDGVAKKRTVDALLADMPELIHQYKDGVQFDEMYCRVANNTPATADHIKEVAILLMQAGELQIVGPKGESRRKAGTISGADILSVPRQKIFFPGLYS